MNATAVMRTPSTLTADPLYAEWKEPFELAILDAERDIGSIYRDKDDRDAFLHAVWRQFRANPKLQGCTAASIRTALVDLALSGLDITQRGEVWLLPFENSKKDPATGKTLYSNNKPVKDLECSVQDGYLGRIKLARQHPSIQDAWGCAVRANDEYQYHGYHALPTHSHPAKFAPRGPIIGVYACVSFTNGTHKCLEMSKDDVLHHRDQYSRAASSDVWQENLSEWQDKNGRRQRVETGKENRSFEPMAVKVITNKLCHPREIPMTRHATRIITQQETLLATLHEAPIEERGVSRAPVAAVNNTTLLFGETPPPTPAPPARDDYTDALLASIREDFYSVGPLDPLEVGTLLQDVFGVKTWDMVKALSGETLLTCMPAWREALTAIHRRQTVETSQEEPPPPMLPTLPDDGWREAMTELLPALEGHPDQAQCRDALGNRHIAPGQGSHMLSMARDVVAGLEEEA